MNERYDFILDDNYDLQIVNGDFYFGKSVQQEAKIAILSMKGDIRQYPTYGVGLIEFIGSPLNSLIVNNVIQNELNKDKIKVKSFDYNYDYTKQTQNIQIDVSL